MPDTAPIPGQTAPQLPLTIVIPVYNGATSIGEVVAALEELTIDGGHEIVLVNDGSPDDSLAVCRDLVERARVPMRLSAKPVKVLIRSGMTEKLTNMLSHSRNSRRIV